ncbi:hypothetical protein BS78_10G260000 [Paspalum vaginatum]|nr:hypothetical protein BS78_10G260000 [Paspalum vaginatum]
MAAATLARGSLPAALRLRVGALARPRRSAAGSGLQLDGTARDNKQTPTWSSLVTTVRCAATNTAGEALQAAPRSVTVHMAYALQQAGHRYLDVRTESEFSAGHPESAVNIPYLFRTASGTTKNARFLEQVARTFGKDDGIIVGCQSGKRSLMAATELCSAGFTAVTDIAGGFSSWKESGLPVNHVA